MGTEAGAGKIPRVKASGGKGARASGRPDAAKVKTSLSLSVEARKILDRHSTEAGPGWSEIVEALILEHVPRYRVALLRRGAEEEGEAAA